MPKTARSKTPSKSAGRKAKKESRPSAASKDLAACQQCVASRYKCDHNHSTCARCMKRGIACSRSIKEPDLADQTSSSAQSDPFASTNRPQTSRSATVGQTDNLVPRRIDDPIASHSNDSSIAYEDYNSAGYLLDALSESYSSTEPQSIAASQQINEPLFFRTTRPVTASRLISLRKHNEEQSLPARRDVPDKSLQVKFSDYLVDKMYWEDDEPV